MNRFVVGALLALVVASGNAPPLVYGSTLAGGTEVQISGLNDLSATVDGQARKGAGKIFAMILGMSGLGLVVSGRMGLGLGGLGSGLAMGFVPGMVSSTFDAAPAATLDLLHGVPSDAWWAPATVALYPLLLLLKFLQDPVVLAAVAVVLVSSRVLGQIHARAWRTA
jgi:hypothetical protein